MLAVGCVKKRIPQQTKCPEPIRFPRVDRNLDRAFPVFLWTNNHPASAGVET